MKKDILAKAVRLADKTKARPEKVVIAKPAKHPLIKKPAAKMLTERLYTRLTKAEKQRLMSRIGEMFPIAELLRDLVIVARLRQHAAQVRELISMRHSNREVTAFDGIVSAGKFASQDATAISARAALIQERAILQNPSGHYVMALPADFDLASC